MGDEAPGVPWEQVAAAASSLAAQSRVADMAARLLALLESWASPSAVLCAYRDPGAPEGVRVVPELTIGSVTAGAERALSKLFNDYPQDALTRPTILAAPEAPAGSKVRDTLVVPWAHGQAVSGFLVLRGLPRPQPGNLGDAVALLAQPLWPRLAVRAEAARRTEKTSGDELDKRLEEIATLSERLRGDLRGARTTAEAELGELKAEFARLKEAAKEAEQERDKGALLAKALADAELERNAARGEAAEIRGRLEMLQRDVDALRARAEEASTLGKAKEGAEKERDHARGETAELQGRLEGLQQELNTLRAGAEEASTHKETLGKAKEAAEKERDQARGETNELQGRLETLQRELDTLRPRAEEAGTQGEGLSKAKEAAEKERDQARGEAAELRGRIETLQHDLDVSRSQAEGAGARAEAAAKAREGLEKERDEARGEFAGLKSSSEALKADLEAARAQHEALLKAKEEFEKGHQQARTEAEELRSQVELLERNVETATTARDQAENERNLARSEAAELRTRSSPKAREVAEKERDTAKTEAEELRTELEALKKDLAKERSQDEEARGGLAKAEEAARAFQRERDEAVSSAKATAEAGAEVMAKGRAASERWDRSVEVFTSVMEAMRRTPFVPPTVRVWVDEAQALLGPRTEASQRLGKILLLDRDAPMLSSLAGELEKAGLDVLIAHHPDEVTLFLRSPDATGLTALVLDVLALRPDQNPAEVVRSWRQNLPGLNLFLTFRADNAAESERAQRLPTTAMAGFLPRPLQKAAVLDAVQSLLRRSKR